MPPAGANAALRSADGRSGAPAISHSAKVTSQPSPSSEVPAPAPALPAAALPWPALLLRALRLHPALPRCCPGRRGPRCCLPGTGGCPRGARALLQRQHARRQVIVLRFLWYNDHPHVLVPAAGTDPRRGAAAWSMMPGPAVGDARDPPPQGAGRGWQPFPPCCTPGAGSGHLHQPHAPAALLLPRVILASAWNPGLAVQRLLLGHSRGRRFRGQSS